MNKIKCSVGILTFNSAKTLEKCLDSVKNFDEIIICDGGSTDDTLTIAEKYECIVISQNPEFKNDDGTIKNFSGIRNQSFDISRNKWFFFVDSDEYISEELEEEIKNIVSSSTIAAYWVPRKYVYRGEIIDCATTYPNKQMRFFHKDAVKRFIKEVHERIDVCGGAHIGELRNIMYVPIEENIYLLRKKWDRYVVIEVDRAGEITLFSILKSFIANLKISILYFLRLIKIMLFCNGRRMPIAYEIERHFYHIKILRAFWNRRKSKNSNLDQRNMTEDSVFRKSNIFIVIILFIVIFFSTHHLTESPPVWMDEGIITQVARNIADHGINGIQISPEKFVSAGFVTTGYTVTYPVSASLKIFGNGVLQARIVMVFYILLFFVAAYFLAKKEMAQSLVFISLLLLASFAPIYGNGKNVLGEVPGLVFLLAFLFFINDFENVERRTSSLILAGLFAGLSITTKPIFLLLFPAILITTYLYSKRVRINAKKIILFIFSLSIPSLLWISVQFSEDSLLEILSIYANPHNTSFLYSTLHNFKRFFTEMQPMYFLFIIITWAVSLFVRIRRKIDISFSETIAFSFSLLVLFAYLRTVGYYRYFFIGQTISLLYFPLAIYSIVSKDSYKIILTISLSAIILFQFYQTSFHSWIATYYDSSRTRQLKEYFNNEYEEKYFFIYQAPEAVLFLPTSNYSQYLKVTDHIIKGEEQLDKIEDGVSDEIIILSELYNEDNVLFSLYSVKTAIDRYYILGRRD